MERRRAVLAQALSLLVLAALPPSGPAWALRSPMGPDVPAHGPGPASVAGAQPIRPDPSRPVADGPGAGCWTKPTTYHTGMTGAIGTSVRVRSAVIGYQRLLIAAGFMEVGPAGLDGLSGIYGPRTRAAVMALQNQIGEPVDGRLGREESLALFKPFVEAAEAAHGVPGRYLWGLLNEEGCGDYGAQGVADPADRGPFQWNRTYFNDCSGRCEAYMPDEVAWGRPFTIYGTAESIVHQLRLAAGRWRASYDWFRSDPDFACSPFHCREAAILYHTRPVQAVRYALDGAPPSFADALYVGFVKAFARGAPPGGGIEFGPGYPCPLARWTYADGTHNPCAWAEAPIVPAPR